MLDISRLRNPIQNYAWGSRTAIAEFLGRPSPTPEPEAELWMGAHPGGPSEVEIDGVWRSLIDVIAEVPEQVLGASAIARHGADLPFLFKVLAAGQALSIQAHPNRKQAAAGCRREDALGILRSAPERNYRDSHHKPEVLYALTPFAILRGFRPPAEILERLKPLGIPAHLPEVGEALSADDLKAFFSAYMTVERERLSGALDQARKRIEAGEARGEEFDWVVELERRFPGDRGVLAPLFLHFLVLAPGDAIFTGPGVLHAYLEGLGIELMANSDNVVRGGLTPKHVDVGELLAILRFEPQPPRLLDSTRSAGERRFERVAEEFALSVIEVKAGEDYRGSGGSVEILLCSRGEGVIKSLGKPAGAAISFARGDSLLVPATAGDYRIAGDATLFRASTPDGE